jgi:hypothetical protein
MGYSYTRLLIAERLVSFLNFLPELAKSIVLDSGAFLLIGVLTAGLLTFFRQIKSWALLGAVAIIGGVTLGTGLIEYTRVLNYGPENYTNWLSNASPISSDEVREMGSFIRSTTNKNAILASNNFCCAGSDWFTQIEQDPSEYSIEEHGERKWGGANYLLPVETRRRFLIQGLRFQTGSGVASPEQLERLRITLQFANSPSPATVAALKSYGVSGYVVNLSLTTNRDWSSYATEHFRTAHFVFLQLK